MPIRVRPGLERRLHSDQTVLFVVRSTDTQHLDAGMQAVRAAIYAIQADPAAVPGLGPGEANNPAYVTEPIAIPGGRLLMVDFGAVPPLQRLDLPDVVTAALRQAGVEDATIEPAPRMGDRYAALDRFRPLSRAWLRGLDPPDHPRVLARPPRPVLSAAREWLLDERADGDTMVALAISVEVPLTEDDFEPIVGALVGSRAPLPNQTSALTTDFRTRAASVDVGALFGFGAMLTVGGANWTTDELATHMRRQRDLIRAYADQLSWAAILVDPRERNFLIPQTELDDRSEAVPAWYQLFSPEQLQRLGGPPPGSVELPGGRFERTSGEPGAG